MRRVLFFALAGAFPLLSPIPAAAQHTLTNGAGPGSVTVKVDGWGMFGGCPADQTNHSDLMFRNPAGGGPFMTTCYSAILLDDQTGCPAPGRVLLALADTLYPQFPAQATNPPVVVVTPGLRIRTAAPQNVCGLQISVDQSLTGPDPVFATPVEGSTLIRTYTIFNAGGGSRTFNLIHFTDADLGGATFGQNRAGASRRSDTCGLLIPPFLANNEWVFEYDQTNTPGLVYALGAEGVDASGQSVLPAAFRVHVSAAGHPTAAFVSNPFGFLTNAIDGDTNGDLLVNSPELPGDYALMHGLRFSNVAPGATVTAVFRTRLTALDPNAGATPDVQARDVPCPTLNGNHSGHPGVIPILCANGQDRCVQVSPSQPVTVSLAPLPGGPDPTHYVLYATVGQPATGVLSGEPGTADFALWGPPIHPWGLGAFPATGALGNWTGGGAAPGFALISSIPGVALLPGPAARGQTPCGSPILNLPPLPPGLSFTMQALVVDFEARNPFQPISLSNAVTVAVGTACRQQASRCPNPLPAGCVATCPTGITITHNRTVTGTGLGTMYGEVFTYTFVPAGNYCIDVREVITTAPGADGCNCSVGSFTGPALNLNCASAITDTITNRVRNAGANRAPCPCTSTNTQVLECRPKGGGAWVPFATNTHTWSRAANGNITATVTPMGGMGVTHTQAGPACPP